MPENKDKKTSHDSVSEANMLTSCSLKSDDVAAPSLWLITFTDIMALMLTFFVLLYTMSVPEVEKWEEIVSSVNQGFSKFYSPEFTTGPQDTITIDKIDNTEALNLEYLNVLLASRIADNKVLQDVQILMQKDRIAVSMPSDLLFAVGEAEVTLEGKRALFIVAELLNRIRNRVEIVGHSDPRPIPQNADSHFKSNWDLSLARALETSNVLEQAGYSRSLIARGMASARYDELPQSLSEEERLDLARRVDIVIMKDDGRQRGFLQIGSGL